MNGSECGAIVAQPIVYSTQMGSKCGVLFVCIERNHRKISECQITQWRAYLPFSLTIPFESDDSSFDSFICRLDIIQVRQIAYRKVVKKILGIVILCNRIRYCTRDFLTSNGESQLWRRPCSAGHNCDFYRQVTILTRPFAGQICDLKLWVVIGRMVTILTATLVFCSK